VYVRSHPSDKFKVGVFHDVYFQIDRHKSWYKSYIRVIVVLSAFVVDVSCWLYQSGSKLCISVFVFFFSFSSARVGTRDHEPGKLLRSL
jgi:hypothetical protein